jgi:hypothetical protein
MYYAISARWLPLIPSARFSRLSESWFITVIEKTCCLLRQRSFLLRPGMPQGQVSPPHEIP